MARRWTNDLTRADVTPKAAFMNRRQIMAGMGAAGLGALASPSLADIIKTDYGKDLKPNSFEDISSYNNFYEFGTGKADPAENAHALTTKPWKEIGRAHV